MPTTLKDEAVIVGIGQTEFSKNSGRSELQLACEAVRNAIRDAGLPIASPCGDDLICAGCGVWIHEGRTAREAPVEADAKRRNRVPSGQRLACAVRVRDDLVVSADYWGEDKR